MNRPKKIKQKLVKCVLSISSASKTSFSVKKEFPRDLCGGTVSIGKRSRDFANTSNIYAQATDVHNIDLVVATMDRTGHGC